MVSITDLYPAVISCCIYSRLSDNISTMSTVLRCAEIPKSVIKSQRYELYIYFSSDTFKTRLSRIMLLYVNSCLICFC